jgi:L-alanine-DL-glutamate epimerase-like enolase superfamily enzyme
MKITDIKCAVIASSPVIQITTDEGITGWSQIETPKPLRLAMCCASPTAKMSLPRLPSIRQANTPATISYARCAR